MVILTDLRKQKTVEKNDCSRHGHAHCKVIFKEESLPLENEWDPKSGGQVAPAWYDIGNANARGRSSIWKGWEIREEK